MYNVSTDLRYFTRTLAPGFNRPAEHPRTKTISVNGEHYTIVHTLSSNKPLDLRVLIHHRKMFRLISQSVIKN